MIQRSCTNKETEQIDFLSENAKIVLERRYLKKDAAGEVCETPEHMFRRVAAHIAEAEKNYDPKTDIKVEFLL
nr:ribonucleotide reductase N-terminal alpha domain-containing protein [uncultured Desulfobacter sp.]